MWLPIPFASSRAIHSEGHLYPVTCNAATPAAPCKQRFQPSAQQLHQKQRRVGVHAVSPTKRQPMMLGHKRMSCAGSHEVASPLQRECEDFIDASMVLAGLRFASWCHPTADLGTTTSRAPSAKVAPVQQAALSSDEEQSDDEEYRPSKVRVIHSGTSGTPIILPRRSYTWRGASRRQQQQLQQQHAPEDACDSTTAIGAALAPSQLPPAHAPTSSYTAVQQPAAEAAEAAAGVCCSGARPPAVNTKEGDKEWAALTTWLRMNLHNPRTAKKVVLFVGQRDASTGRWTFGLNPALSWAADVSLDTKLRLRDLPAEAQAAFARKYPARKPGEWCLKSQKYKPPGSSQTYQVPLEQLVLSLHCMYETLEASAAAPAGSSGSQDSEHTAAGACMAAPSGTAAASPTHSHNS